MKALVTGSTGFIGSHIVEALLEKDIEVKVLVRRETGLGVVGGLDVEKVLGDVRDADSVAKAIRGCDAIFHAAALVGEWGSPKDFYEINVQGMRNMIAGAAASGVSRIIDISSTSVHGYEGFDHDTEELPYKKTGVLYSDTKLEAERLVWEAHAEGKICASTVRPAMVWGPRDRAFLTKIINSIKKHVFAYIDNGTHIVGLAHARNVCDIAIRALMTEAAAGKAFIATDDCDTTMRAVVEKICEEMSLPKPRMSVPYSVAKNIAAISESTYRRFNAKSAPLMTRMGVGCIGNSLSFDVTRAKTVLGYKPLYKFPQGLREYIDWYNLEYPAAASTKDPQ